jgi:hypothetical protein
MRSYLAKRTQNFYYNGQYSQHKPIRNGVPQGSVLEPILFNLHMAPLGKISTDNGDADDVLVYFNLEGILRYQNILDTVSKWLLENGLAINSNKMQAILLRGRGNSNNAPKLYVMGKEIIISLKGFMKYLVVHIDSHLEFSTHIRETSKAAFKRLQIIRRARFYMDHTTAAVLCKSLVLSRLKYCATILSNII